MTDETMGHVGHGKEKEGYVEKTVEGQPKVPQNLGNAL
jgi:hypothetical protein